MAVTLETLGFIAPEFAKIPDERFQFILNIATSQINPNVFKAQTDYATALFVAHLLTVFNRKGNLATEESKVGDVQRKYATPNEFKNYLHTTSYGTELWALIKRCVVTPYVAGDGGNNNPSSQVPRPPGTGNWPPWGR